jgi:hypothetical protein
VEDHARSVDAASCGRGRSALPIAGELRGDIQSAVAVCQSASGVADADSVEGGEGHFTNFQSKRLSDEHLAAQGYARGKPLRRKSSARRALEQSAHPQPRWPATLNALATRGPHSLLCSKSNSC